MFLIAIFMSLNAYCAKMLSKINTFEIILFYSIVMLLIYICISFRSLKNFKVIIRNIEGNK